MAVRVNIADNIQDSTHHLSLKSTISGSTEYGLIIPGGVENIQQSTYTPTSLQYNLGRQGYGSFEPPYTSIDQTDWTGGLGQLKYTDTSKFYDSYNMWTLTPDVLMPAPLWRFAKGITSTSADHMDAWRCRDSGRNEEHHSILANHAGER
jgi:hypothetical protein